MILEDAGVWMKVESESKSNVLTPLGASLDEQSSSTTKGPPRNGCSFEDDLSLGAEANLLQNGTAKPDHCYATSLQAKEKRSQFRQKGRSMNSTGSGKSSGTVSSVSELLDLYEEDPEEILYNLGFGREEPDIASKIPSRFFNSSSYAKGIDIKVYLEAQMQRMELENPNYALTSRFRQTEVLATVANVFSEIYCQVSGRPLEKICQMESPPKEPVPLRRNSSALNAVKILKRNLTRPNLLNSSEGTPSPPTNPATSDAECQSDSESKLLKAFKKRDSLSLATVTEESNQGIVDVCSKTKEGSSAHVNGDLVSAGIAQSLINGTKVSKHGGTRNGGTVETNLGLVPEKQKKISSSSSSDKEPGQFLPNPHMAHLLSQPRDSFEMEELQSNEDEAVSGTHCFSRFGSEALLRTISQQSDSSGFAEDPSSDGSANFLKVQESSDSCDSEATVTSHASGDGTSVMMDQHALERLLKNEELPTHPTIGLFNPTGTQKDISEHSETAESETQIQERPSGFVIMTGSSSESGSTVESTDPALSTTLCSETKDPHTGSETTPVRELELAGELGSTAETDGSSETNAFLLSSSSTGLEPVVKSESTSSPSVEQSFGLVPESESCTEEEQSTSKRVRGALLRAQQRSSSYEDQRGRVWVRSKELLQNHENRLRNPLTRSSSLPTSFLSPTRVVSSMRIQIGKGSVRQCTPPCYSYRYEEERDEANSIAEEDEDDTSASRSNIHNPSSVDSYGLNPQTEVDGTTMPPYPLNVSPHLTRSASSLYSVPADWPTGRLAECPVWSSSSVPDLTQHPRMPHPAIPRHIQQELPQYRGAASSPYQKSVTPPSRSYTPVNSPYPYTPSALNPQPQISNFPYPPYTAPLGTTFPQPFTHPPSAPYHSSPPFYSPPPGTPYGSTFNLQGGPQNPQMPLTHPYSSPYGLAFSNAPYHPNIPDRHQYNSPFHSPPLPFTPLSAPFPCNTPTPPSLMGSTEMQLRRVLHEIRGTVQSLNQGTSEQRVGTPSGAQGPRQMTQSLHEEFQKRRGNLNLFRTQMMDLELSLMRQQSMVYQYLSPDERHEAEHLQRLRVAVRHELQELELQLEERFMDDQIHSARSSRLYRHPLVMSRGQSMDSLFSSSALRATEPVSDLLREQMFLQSELNYDGGLSSAGTASAHSSRSASPAQHGDPDDFSSSSAQRGRGGVYRSTVSLTPSIPSRSGAESQEPPATLNTTTIEPEVRDQRSLQSRSAQVVEGSAEVDAGGVVEEAGGNLQHLIKQIKQSLADEIRQEIVNEILAAVSPRRSPVEPTP
ncbi:protein ITPRID2 isoform X2 [Trichomycterus rosablanca]|uniref:protein ITPRID2 isoform X2 n=1 Tax=Trichomycterus rosablanca TaxID=2290929 RepID=UPI002F360432